MPADRLRVVLHGVRGSVPAAGPHTARYGGDTISLEVDLGTPEHRLVIDAGTGLRQLAVDTDDPAPVTFEVLFTHFHWDHLEGIGFFPAIFKPQYRFNFRGRPEGFTVQEALEGALRPPWFPVPLADTPSERTYEALTDRPQTFGDIEVTTCPLNHPQGVVGYLLRSGERTIAFATDHEAGDSDIDDGLVDWARGADVLIHDAQYTAEDYDAHRGWGHSSWDHAVDAAIAADVGQLIAISHDPSRTDDEIDALVEAARSRFPRTSAARAGMVIEL